MHRTRRAARSLAWRDEKNPFGKSMYWKRKQGTDQLETGEHDHSLVRVRTDDPADYREPPTSSTDYSPGGAHGSNHTAPSAVSRRRINEPGDAISEIPATTSPEGSIKGVSTIPEHPTETTNEKQQQPPEYVSRTTTDAPSPSGSHHKIPSSMSKLIPTWGTGDSDKDHKKDDDAKPKPHFTVMSQIRNTIFNSWINVLLIACPVGIALHYAKQNDWAVFVVNFIAIIPLAGMLSFATEEIALRVGEVLGGLLNASFGNAVELIVSIIALVKHQVVIVQTSLIGSILSNLLLVMGMCFFAGGVNRIEQEFNVTVAQTASSLLFLAVSSLIIPTAFAQWANSGSDSQANQQQSSSTTNPVYGAEQISLATAVVLLFVYACYLFFQLKSHTSMYNAPSKKNQKRDMSKQKARVKRLVPGKMRKRSPDVPVGATLAQTARNQSNTPSIGSDDNDSEDEREEPQLALWVAILTLGLSTALVALNAECLVDSIDKITCESSISKVFVGLILLPIVGNAAEHATAVTVAIKDKMDLAIGVAVGSSMQIALLVLPFMVVLGQIIGEKDMTLFFDGFQIAVLFVTVLLVNYLIQDGKSHWLEGVLLMVLYIIIAVAAWYYPTNPELNDCPGK